MVLVDGALTFRSAQLGDSQLDITNTSITGTGAINFPGFGESQAGQPTAKR